MINISQLHTELKKKGKTLTYVQVKSALEGIPNSTTEQEKREIIAVLEKQVKIVKENVMRS